MCHQGKTKFYETKSSKIVENMIEIVNTFFYYSLFFFKNIIETFSAVLAFSGEEIIVCNYSPTGFARFAFGC